MSIFHPSKANVGIDALITSDQRLGQVKVFKEQVMTHIAISDQGYIAIYQPGGKRSATNLIESINRGFKSEIVEESLNAIHISTVVAFDLLIDNKSGLGSAALGGLIAGGAGAIIGHAMGSSKTKRIDLQIKTNDFANPQILVPLYDSADRKNDIYSTPIWGGLFKALAGKDQKRDNEIQELMVQLDNLHHAYIISKDASVANAPSSADELAKFKKLLDDGVISQNEFDAKKQQLLGI